MIHKEFIKKRDDGANLYRTYSDKNVYIEQEQTKARYTEAIDVENSIYTYIETDIEIEKEPEPPNIRTP